MLKLLAILAFVIVIVGACHLLGHAQTPPGPQPTDPMIVVGGVQAHPNMALYATVISAQKGLGNDLLGPTSALAAVRVDNEKRVTAAFAQFRALFPNTYKATMLKNGLKMTDDTF